MSDGLHASLTPNHVAPGETVTVRFDSQEEEFVNAQDVTIRIFEVDDASPLEPRRGRNSLIVEFRGNLADNDFRATGAPRVTNVRGTPPRIRIRVEPDTEVEVPLPGADVEQGVFELRLEVRSGRPAATYRTPEDATVFVRAYDHFRTQGIARPEIAFVTGASSDTFFAAAQGFWRRNADAVLIREGISIKEILDVLETEGAKYGPWGRIDIVAHGAPYSINLKIFADSPGTTHEGIIDRELERAMGNLGPQFLLATPDSIDGQTEVVFRACNAGQTPSLVRRLKDEFFRAAKFVKVPKWIQGYESSRAHASEFFMEELEFDRQTKAQLERDEAAEIPRQFDAVKTRSPGLNATADPAVEIPLFTVRKFSEGHFEFTRAEEMERDLVDANGRMPDDAALIAAFRTAWNQPPLDLHETPETARTRDDRWLITLSKSVVNRAAEDRRGLWFESAAGTPRFMQLGGGTVTVGSRSGDANVWEIRAEGVEEIHAQIYINQQTPQGETDFDRVEIEHDTDNPDATTVVGRQTLTTRGQRVIVRVPTTIAVGQARIAVRRGRVYTLRFNATRHFLHRRRDMRQYDAGTAYADRPLVAGDLANPQLYETAE